MTALVMTPTTTEIEDALHAWAVEWSGVEAIWADTAGPKPAEPYLSMKIIARPAVGPAGHGEVQEGEGEEPDFWRYIIQHQELTLSLNLIGGGPEPLESLRLSLDSEAARAALEAAADLVPVADPSITDLSFLQESLRRQRHHADIRFRVGIKTVEDITATGGYIEGVTIEAVTLTEGDDEQEQSSFTIGAQPPATSFADDCEGPGVDEFWTEVGVGGPTISEDGVYRVEGDNTDTQGEPPASASYNHTLETPAAEISATLGVGYISTAMGGGNGLDWEIFSSIFSGDGDTSAGFQMDCDALSYDFGARMFFKFEGVEVWTEDVQASGPVVRPFNFNHSAEFKLTQNGDNIELRVDGVLKYTQAGTLSPIAGFYLNRFTEDNVAGAGNFAQIAYGTIDDILVAW